MKQETTWFEYPDTQPMDHQKVLVSGGIAQYRKGVFLSGMEDPQFRREIQWNVTMWAEIPHHDEMSDNRIVCDCIDIGEWKHSWHNSLDTYDKLLEAKSVIQEEIERRIVDMGRLRIGLKSVTRMMERF